MTLSEFVQQRDVRPCGSCGRTAVETELNPNNNGLLVICSCGSKRPWGSLLYLRQNERKRSTRPPLPEGDTLDSIWEKFGNRCVLCSAPKSFLSHVGIGRHVHHVAPYAQQGHRGPLVPICTHCHAVANERQRVYWFYHRVVMKPEDEDSSGHDAYFSNDATKPPP
jgi:hypothetical protein